MKKMSRYFVFLLLTLLSCNCQRDKDSYVLVQEVVFSRHNIRSPLSTRGSDLERVTPCEWVDWGVPAAFLTPRGGRIEEQVGAYFYSTVSEPLGPFDNGNTLFYANSRQRTKATATHFLQGFDPELTLYYTSEEDVMDPLFMPQFTFMSEALHERIIAEMNAAGGAAGTPEDPYKGIRQAISTLTDDIRFMEGIIDFSHSPYALENGVEHLPTETVEIITEVGDEPRLKGDYQLINSIADALVLQYYETGSEFGKAVTMEDVRRIGHVKTVYDEMLFGTPTASTLVSHPLVAYIRKELGGDAHRFTFLCGHDSNIASLSTALGFEMPPTVDAVEHRTPIGSKIVFRKYRKGSEYFVDIRLVYASVSQLRETVPIDAAHTPVTLSIGLEGLQRNADGYYTLEDVLGRFDTTLSRYEELAASAAVSLP